MLAVCGQYVMQKIERTLQFSLIKRNLQESSTQLTVTEDRKIRIDIIWKRAYFCIKKANMIVFCTFIHRRLTYNMCEI